MSIKQVLEAIWNDPQVRCPGHRTWWFDGEELTYHKREPRGLKKEWDDLYYARGKKVETDAQRG